MANQAENPISEYTSQAFNRLAKEKLVTMISTLQAMPLELAMKVSEHIPGYFRICSESLGKIHSVQETVLEKHDKDAQRVFDALEARRNRLEELLRNADTSDEREKYERKLEETEKEIEDTRIRISEERKEISKSHMAAALMITSLAAASIGITIKFGKSF